MTTPSDRQLLSFNDGEINCTRVKVKGDATYCIKGLVCGATWKHHKVQGACPVEGDAAIHNCTSASRSYVTGCRAPVDAQCVIKSTGGWECVFPHTNFEKSTTEEEQMQAQALSTPNEQLTLSATNQESTKPSESMLGVSNLSIYVAVGIACCVLAIGGLVFYKKRRNRNRERFSSYALSEKDISIVTL